jgi:hypothetical protein
VSKKLTIAQFLPDPSGTLISGMAETLRMKFTADEARFLKRLGMKLRELRQSKGWTLEETEDHGWISWRHLQDIESGRNLTMISLRRAAKLYRVPLSKIFADIE